VKAHGGIDPDSVTKCHSSPAGVAHVCLHIQGSYSFIDYIHFWGCASLGTYDHVQLVSPRGATIKNTGAKTLFSGQCVNGYWSPDNLERAGYYKAVFWSEISADDYYKITSTEAYVVPD
jgi:hypothetical protein